MTPAGPSSDRRPLRIVPKGLRSFDAGDADFFLELLPGPRDRDGMPDGLRFWKGRIEETDPDLTFPVGLIYGPSGCGKSSLVKAGLLPRLADHVLAVYIEATATETEARLLKALRKHGPGLPADVGLAETLTTLRRGGGLPAGKKVLIVLDQFEQWLHARQADDNTELVQALRQCDGERVQCLVMVRDDFWLAVSRFMKELEVRVVEGHNSALVDLFDLRHARRVLAAFGRAFGALPESPGQLTREQNDFLDRGVAGLAEEGKVISVRLALFAEMVKGKPWLPPTLKAVGGMEGVGVAFLEETFSATSAPPQHRVHQQATRAVLKALLPEQGTDIKGHMRSHDELLEASGYGRHPGDFEELLKILDSEVRLITPTDPEGREAQVEPGPVAAGAKYYQLTHDYLVPSLRAWLTRKQKETRRGRAELRLAERAALWTARPQNRHLPAWWEWATIRLLTRTKNWTPAQRKMMRRAAGFHGVRGAVLALLLAAATFIGLGIRRQVSEQRKADHAAALVRGLLSTDVAQVPGIITELGAYRPWADPLLRQENQAASADSPQKLFTSLALLAVDEGQVEDLYQRLLKAGPTELPVISEALRGHRDALVGRLWAVLEDRQAEPGQRFRAACALASYDDGNLKRWDGVAPFVADRLLGAVQQNPSHYDPLLKTLRPVRDRLLRPLSVAFRGAERAQEDRSWSGSILADYAADRPEVLADLIQDADDKQFAVLFPKLAAHRERALALMGETLGTALESQKTDEEKERLVRRQANAAVALLRLGQAEAVWPLLKHPAHPQAQAYGFSDPRVRSYLIHRLSPLGADPQVVIRQLKMEKEVSIRRALLLAVGEFRPDQLSPAAREPLLPVVWQLYREEPDAGLHGAAEWLLRQWGQQDKLKQFEQRWANDEAKQKEKRKEREEQIHRELIKKTGQGQGYWYVNGQGQTMVVIPGPVEFLMGSPPTEAGREGGPEGAIEKQHHKRIGRSFALAAKEVTVEQFLRFRQAHAYNKNYSPTLDCPVNKETWYDAAAYCNWLSEQEGIPEDQWCYLPNPSGKYAEGMKLAPDYLGRTGYRLPTEAEWEYACRAGTVTSRYYGATDALLGKYAWYTKNSQDRGMLPGAPGGLGVPGDCLKPNDLGLFDMLGNALEWCQDQLVYYSTEELDDKEDENDKKDIKDVKIRVLRGGSFLNLPVLVRSALRLRLQPTVVSILVGFRPARTFR